MDEVSFPYHEHPLHRSGGFGLLCAGCVKVAYSSDGYRCSECYGHRFFLHKECAESPLQITLSSHPQHPLHFIGTYHDHEKTCHLCGDYISEVSYHCFTCHIYVHIGCARDPPMPVIKNPMDHRGFLTLVTQIMGFTCDVCGGESHSYCYMCHHCYFFCHIGCISLYPEITHPSHPHPLRFLENGEPHYSDGKCGLCGEEFENGRLYHCSACNYSLDLTCVKYPPPLSYVSPKTHEHELTLLPGNMSFTCDACGEYGYRSPYACHQCDIKFHQTCFDLPLLINNNRHDHPIHRTYLFDRGLDLFCGVCHGKLDGPSEAYVCVSCDNFAVHSICATGFRVWDGRELKGKPDEMEDTEPFRVVNGNLINHFSHEEHELRLKNDGNVCQDNIHCRACVRPIDTDPFYSCTQCDFVLHETCANLPRTKRHPLSTTKLTLTSSENFPEGSFTCDACKRHSSGFGYSSGSLCFDVQCISISEPLNHDSHPHALYCFSVCCPLGRDEYCNACGKTCHLGFRCNIPDCDFALDYGCATLPKMVTRRESNDHPLFLRYGGNVSVRFQCHVCKKKLDLKKWFYANGHYSTASHVKCTVGDFSGLTEGTIITHCQYDPDRIWDPYSIWGFKNDVISECDFEVVANDSISGPCCHVCRSRSNMSLMLKTSDGSGRYICSYDCLSGFHPARV